MNQTRLRQLLSTSKLMALTLILFLLAYSGIGFVLFDKGFNLLERVPSVGGLLADRMIYLIFFFFSIMLVFSIGVTNFIGLIKGREVSWLLTQPLSHRALFMWKSTEAIVFASWGLVFICAPLLIAYATSRDAHGIFYLKAIFAIVPFVVISAALGNSLFLALLRWAPKRFGLVLGALTLVGMTLYGWEAYRDVVAAQKGGTTVTVQINQVFQYTQISRHKMLPSTWMSELLVQWTRQLSHNVPLHLSQLWSTALVGLMLMAWLGRRWFFAGWNRSLQRAAAAASRRRDRAKAELDGWSSGRRFILSRPILAVVAKDVRCFVREPSQWVQFVIVFGLLLVYVLNLRNMGYDIDNPFWAAVISYINLTVSSLALSTLTTRFVFPLFSLEGSKLWILGMAPLGLDRVVIQKWVQAVIFTGTVTTGLQLVSGWMLGLEFRDVAFFTGAIALMSMGLCGISVGLGALFPNLEETNAAKIVSGFGGTLCLIVSFCYIAALVSVLTLAKVMVFRTKGLQGEIAGTEGWLGWAIAGAIGLTLLFGGGCMFLAMYRVKKMQLLGPLS